MVEIAVTRVRFPHFRGNKDGKTAKMELDSQSRVHVKSRQMRGRSIDLSFFWTLCVRPFRHFLGIF